MSDQHQYVTLGLDRDVFAIPVANVREILDMQPAARLPQAPPFLLGLIDVRGRSVPVIDLRAKLGLPSVDVTDSTRILVLDMMVNDRPVVLGLVADRVFEVASLDSEAMEAPPEIGSRWRSEVISGIGRRGSSFVIIFDLPKLFACDTLAALGTAPADLAA